MHGIDMMKIVPMERNNFLLFERNLVKTMLAMFIVIIGCVFLK